MSKLTKNKTPFSPRNKKCGVYKITSPCGKIYIGASTDIYNRWCSYKGLTCKSQTKLYDSLRKHGANTHTFEIIEECEESLLAEKEFNHGTALKVLSVGSGLNSRLPMISKGCVCMSGDTKEKISKSNKGKRVGVKMDHYESKLKKLTIDQVSLIKKELIDNELTQLEISKKYNVSRKIISGIRTGKNYRTIDEDMTKITVKPKYIKLDTGDYKNIEELYSKGKSYREIATIYNIDYSHVYRIINTKTYIKTREV